MNDFLRAILQPQGYIEIRTIDSLGHARPHFFVMDDVESASALATHEDEAGKDVYYGVLNRVRPSGRAADCVSETSVLWLDVDAKQFDGDKAAALFSLGKAGLVPSILVDSGHGWHGYYLLREPVPFTRAQAAMKGLAKAVGGDNVSDAPRILRIPGTHNHKGGGNVPVRLLHFAPRDRYRFSDFIDYTFVPPTRTMTLYDGDDWEPSRPDAYTIPDGQRNTQLARMAGAMVARHMTPETMLMALSHENQTRCVPPLPLREVEAIVRSVSRYAA